MLCFQISTWPWLGEPVVAPLLFYTKRVIYSGKTPSSQTASCTEMENAITAEMLTENDGSSFSAFASLGMCIS